MRIGVEVPRTHTWARKATEHLWEEIRSKENTWRNITLDLGREDIRTKIKEFAKEGKERIEETRGKKYYGGINGGINQLLEDEWNGGEERENREEERGTREARDRGEQGNWVFGGNLRSTTRGTEREIKIRSR